MLYWSKIMADKIDILLEDLAVNRNTLHEMVKDISEFKSKMTELLPKSIDFRNKFIWEEKMKTISTILGTELAIRKQIDDSIKSEINIRTKMDSDESDSGRDLIEAISRKIEDGTIKYEK
jgi:hypothetical protein